MHTTYRLNASELDQSFVEGLKATFSDKEIEIVVYEVDETAYLFKSEANKARLLAAKANVEEGSDLIEVQLQDLP